MVVLNISDPKDPMAQIRGREAEKYIRIAYPNASIIDQLYTTNDKEYFIFNAVLMYNCDAIFLPNKWGLSEPISKLNRLANDIGLVIIIEPNDEWNHYAEIIARVSVSIEKATGISFEDFTSKSHNRRLYYSRLIFYSICTMNQIPAHVIEDVLNRHKTTVKRSSDKVKDELKLNKAFSNLHKKAEDHFNEGLLTDFVLEKFWKEKINRAVLKKGIKVYHSDTVTG